jgi:hypothetical protein
MATGKVTTRSVQYALGRRYHFSSVSATTAPTGRDTCFYHFFKDVSVSTTEVIYFIHLPALLLRPLLDL